MVIFAVFFTVTVSWRVSHGRAYTAPSAW